ncbi:hypothetical protein [Deinococcus hohokamensis]|uniref:Soluble ligand binding domain-containing protein n=1 Tax=Deinococcus hohokamensis TaxID=309883 RepID=A0ABV9I7E4_9DEIO
MTPLVSADRTKVLLPLRSGTRTIMEAGRPVTLKRPPSVVVQGVTLVSFERADLRDEAVLDRAAALVLGVGSRRGVRTLQGGYRDSVAVRVDGLTVTEERERVRGPSVIRLEEAPEPKVRSAASARSLVAAVVALSAGAAL